MFQVNGLRDLFNVPPAELIDRFYDASDVLGTAARDLLSRLADCETFQQRVEVADAILSNRLSTARRRDLIASTADHIVASDGLVQIAELAHSASLGARQFRRL